MSARGAVRLARPDDAEPLCLLNARFNGAGLCTAAQVRAALACPGSEVVAVCELDGTLAGFACAQVKRSFCYPRPTAEITELFVDAPFRRQGIARRLLAFLEAHCMQGARRRRLHAADRRRQRARAGALPCDGLPRRGRARLCQAGEPLKMASGPACHSLPGSV